MKISLNQPNGFPTMFAPDSQKYTDLKNPSNKISNEFRHLKQEKQIQPIYIELWYSRRSSW